MWDDHRSREAAATCSSTLHLEQLCNVSWSGLNRTEGATRLACRVSDLWRADNGCTSVIGHPCVMTPVRWRSLYQAVEKETTTCLIVFYSDQHGFILPDEFIVLSVSSIIPFLVIVKDTNMVVSPWRTSFEAEVEIRLNASWLGVSSVSDTTPEEYVEFSTSNKTSILSP